MRAYEHTYIRTNEHANVRTYHYCCDYSQRSNSISTIHIGVSEFVFLCFQEFTNKVNSVCTNGNIIFGWSPRVRRFTPFKFQISNFKFQISKFRLELRDLGYPKCFRLRKHSNTIDMIGIDLIP